MLILIYSFYDYAFLVAVQFAIHTQAPRSNWNFNVKTWPNKKNKIETIKRCTGRIDEFCVAMPSVIDVFANFDGDDDEDFFKRL